jgi:D-tyrosyl-tRNA(Tyr) deacylase
LWELNSVFPLGTEELIGLLQRVTGARVEVDGSVVGQIGPGLLVLVAVEPGDTEAQAERLADRLARYRVFEDDAGRMNLSLLDTGGGLLLVPQFTLAADTSKGLRPSFTSAAAPELGRHLFDHAVSSARRHLGDRVATGRFGAHMQVSLTNDGPVTFWLRHTSRSATSPPG